MKIVFRVDSYPVVGMGHIIRSISIAKKLRVQNENVELIFFGVYDKYAIELLQNDNIKYINNSNLIESEQSELFDFLNLNNPQIIFIDKLFNYSSDFIKSIRPLYKVVMFHNLCEGAFYSHKFILPSAHTTNEVIEDENWGNGFVDLYWGPKYIAINDKIKELKKSKRNSNVFKIAITTGGSDPKGVMNIIIEMMSDIKFENVEITALKGKSFIHEEKLNQLSIHFRKNIRIEEFDYSNLINSDLVISTFGVTTYELIYMGIPNISIGHTISNAIGSEILDSRYKCIINAGLIDNLKKEIFLSILNDCIMNKDKLEYVKGKMKNFIDGNGIERITKIILK